jgi:hypothetical protein
VSGGGYSPAQQDCPSNADRNNAPTGQTSPGCHTAAFNLESGKGTRYAEFGIDQLPNGYSSTPTPIALGYPGSPNAIHSGCASFNLDGTNGGPGQGCGAGSGPGAVLVFDIQQLKRNQLSIQTGPPNTSAITQVITNGLLAYFGQDDNTDAGEHDGVSGNNGTLGSMNGPSDGGAVGLTVTPAAATQAPSATNPVPVAGVHEGFCADGICNEFTTSKQLLYQGCGANPSVPCSPGTPSSRDVYNYSGKQWDPYNCSSGGTSSESPGPNGCGSRTMDQYRQAEASNVYAQPGFQFYEDPDPQGSPVGPIYPLPAIYAGTCGIAAGGGQFPPLHLGKLTNSAGQIVVAPTGC